MVRIMLEGYKEFAEFIAMHSKNAKKVIEVGIGKERSVFNELRQCIEAEVIAVDLEGESVTRDNVLNPNLEIYKESDVIYSIRPPPELYPKLEEIARSVGAMLIVKPFSIDEPPPNLKLINHKGLALYIIDFRR